MIRTGREQAALPGHQPRSEQDGRRVQYRRSPVRARGREDVHLD